MSSAQTVISLVAGRGVAGYLGDGGPATLAQLNGPTGVAVDAAGGILVVDASNRVRRIAYGTITTDCRFGRRRPGVGGPTAPGGRRPGHRRTDEQSDRGGDRS